MKIAIIANPVSGGGRAYRQLRDYLSRNPFPDVNVELFTTRHAGHAGSLVRDLLERPPDLVAVCGGDGTLNEVACQVPIPPFPVAILPGGTANVVARELRIPLNPIRALHVALKKVIRRVDIGELGPGLRRFIFVAGIGFDAYVVSAVSPRLKEMAGMAAYALGIVQSLGSYPFPEFQVTAPDTHTYTATSCLVCNSRSYGGGLLFCPQADMGDGLFDVLVLEGKGRLRLARFLLMAWLGIPEDRPWVHRIKSRSVLVEGPAHVPVQADGELAGGLPLEITLLKRSFPLIVK